MLVKITLITLSLSTIANLGLAYVAVKKNPKGLINLLFALVSFSVVGWSISDFLGNGQIVHLQPSQTYLFFRLIVTFLAIQNLAFFMLLKNFPGPRFIMNRLLAVFLIIFSIALSSSPFWLGDKFARQMMGMIMPGPGMMVFMVSLILFALSGFVVAIRRVRHLSGQSKNQARYMLVATLLLWVGIPFSDFILPTFFGVNYAYAISPLIALLFALTIAYAIVRQRLFDIRPLAARSLSYGLFLATVVIIYVIVAFGITGHFMHK